MIEWCEDPECPGYGKQLVDRGYGYPVCPSTKMLEIPKPMNPLYKGEYNMEQKNENQC